MGFLINSFIEFPSSFSPDDISSLKNWYDINDISTITKDGSNRVSAVADKKGTDNLLQTTSGDQPLWVESGQNGKSELNCTGDRAMITSSGATISQPVSVYAVLKLPASKASTQRIIEAESGTGKPTFLDNDSNFWKIAAPTEIVSTNADEEDTWVLARIIYNGASSSLALDEVTVISGNAGTNAYTGLDISGEGDSRSNITLGELLKFNAVLSTADNDDLVEYLSDKWNVNQ
tara:strand:+ start:737 stop:1435 length:699 start_codon:yes stop_codon:yes gene_type:complete